MDKTTTNEVLDAHGLAQMLGVGVRSIPRMVDRGELPRPFKLGRLSRWRKTDVEARIAELSGDANREGVMA